MITITTETFTIENTETGEIETAQMFDITNATLEELTALLENAAAVAEILEGFGA
jgi:hypothetical protein